MLNITARVYKVQGESKLKANVSITLEDAFVVGGLKVVEGTNGLFVAMPNRKTDDGEWKDTCFPLNAELRKKITDVVLEEYQK